MTDIAENQGIVTQITTVKVNPNNQDEVLQLMQERARFMATQPGFVSVNLHRSQDGQSRRQLRPMDQRGQAREGAPLAGVPQEMATVW